MDAFWDILNRIAIVATIIGLPVTIISIYNLLYSTVVVYDMYRECDEAGGYAVVIGSFSRRDRKNGKKDNSERQYHKKGLSIENEKNWE